MLQQLAGVNPCVIPASRTLSMTIIPEALVTACMSQDMKTISMPHISSALVSHCVGLEFEQRCNGHNGVYLATGDESFFRAIAEGMVLLMTPRDTLCKNCRGRLLLDAN